MARQTHDKFSVFSLSRNNRRLAGRHVETSCQKPRLLQGRQYPKRMIACSDGRSSAEQQNISHLHRLEDPFFQFLFVIPGDAEGVAEGETVLIEK